MVKRSRSSLESYPITCWSVMHSVLTPRGMTRPSPKKTAGTFRPLERGIVWRSDAWACGYLAGAGRGKQFGRRRRSLRSGVGLLHFLDKAEVGIERIGDINDLVARTPLFRLFPIH